MLGELNPASAGKGYGNGNGKGRASGPGAVNGMSWNENEDQRVNDERARRGRGGNDDRRDSQNSRPPPPTLRRPYDPTLTIHIYTIDSGIHPLASNLSHFYLLAS